MRIRLWVTVAVIFSALSVYAEKWTLTAVADPLQDRGWNSALTAALTNKTSPIKFVVVAGDWDPFQYNLDNYNKVFGAVNPAPYLLPVIGNHEIGTDARRQMVRDAVALLKKNPNANLRDERLNYHVDYNNVRIIAINQYTESGNDLGISGGGINAKGREWVENLIVSAPATIKHIFISYHEPAFPRSRHTTDSFNQFPAERNAFWNMLVKHVGKVRAVFVGHTHSYSRMRVKDPASSEANGTGFPDQAGGVYEVDMGQVKQALNIEIDDMNLTFTVWNTATPNKIVDQWSIKQTQTNTVSGMRMKPANAAVSSGTDGLMHGPGALRMRLRGALTPEQPGRSTLNGKTVDEEKLLKHAR